MKFERSIKGAVLALFLSVPLVQADEPTLPPENVPVLYVQHGQTATFDGHKLVLEDVPHTTWFSDHPDRLAGSMTAEAFLAAWKPGGAFAGDPPNAALVYHEGDKGKTAIVTLGSVKGQGNTGIEYDVEVIKGPLPATARNVTLFVDPGGRTNPTGG